MFTDSFGTFACTGKEFGITCEKDGFTFLAYLMHDSEATPWDNDPATYDGLVTDWTTRDKHSHEMTICRDGNHRRYFDFAGCVARAKAESWGTTPPVDGTPGQKAHEAAMRTFNAVKAWCNDDWHYVGVCIQVSRNGIVLDDMAASLWGIECNYPGSDNSWLVEVANELLDEALTAAQDVLAKINA